MKSNDLRDLSKEDLEKKVLALQEDLYSLRLKSAGGQLADGTRLRHVRRDIARVLTIMGEQASQPIEAVSKKEE